MALAPGTRLGPYEILAPLGAGGMGEVYRARDPRLDREVAIKVVPEEIADRNRLHRFEQEARAAGALNHPNVLDVHDVGTHEGVPYVVSELLEGQTLRARLTSGALPVPGAVDLALQLAHGLAAAHDKGIVHRDLKPDNVFITEDGRVKILDFGLAKLTRRAAPAEGAPGTATRPTESGTVMGTVGYMSPEQARGEEVDHRSDIFSFGAVLYEMLSGRRAFHRNTAVETMNAILNEEPPALSRLDASLPKALEGIVTRCLEKKPRERFQSVRDVAFALEAVSNQDGSGRAWSVTRRGPSRALTATAAGALALVGAFGWWLLSNRSAKSPPEPLKITPFTTDGGYKAGPQFAPDGEKVAYAWSGAADDNFDIYVKALGRGARPLRLTEDPATDFSPAWSPDGRQIAFARRFEGTTSIYTVPSLGGPERKLCDIEDSNPAFTALSWSPDGEWLVFPEKPAKDEPARIVRLSVATLKRQPLTFPPEGSGGDRFPALSPDGTLVAFWRQASREAEGSEVWVQTVGDRRARRLIAGRRFAFGPIVWMPHGDAIAFTWGYRRRLVRLSLSGGAPEVALGAASDVRSATFWGSRVVFEQQDHTASNLWRVPGHGAQTEGAPEELIASWERDQNPAYSPDGRRIAFESSRSGSTNVWICDSDGANAVQLTSFEVDTGTPRWSPDSRRLVFDSVEAGDANIYAIEADGGVPRRLTEEPSADTTATWSRDGRWIYFTSDRSGESQIWKMPAEGGEAVQVTRGGGFYGQESWDGRFLYYTTSSFGGSIWRMPVEGGEEAEVVHGGVDFFWENWDLSPTGLYYMTFERLPPRASRVTIRFLDLRSETETELLRKEGSFGHDSLAVSPDDQWILYGEVPPVTSELMLVENAR